MALNSSFGKASNDALLVLLCTILYLTAVRSSGEWISVKKLTPDPVFLKVGQTLKLRLDIEDLHLDRWNTTAFWVYARDYSEYSTEKEIQWVRQLGSKSEEYYSYNKTRISRERQFDLVMKSMTLDDSGVYRCKFRKPPHPWNIRKEFTVVVEEEEANLHVVLPQIVHITKGDTLKLRPNLPERLANSSGTTYETFWEFSPLTLESTHGRATRIIDLTESSDVRASLQENGTTLVLINTTLKDSGVYHLRMMEPKSTTAVHMDFNVVVEDKPVASLSCPSIVRLSEGESFFCLCEDNSNLEVIAQASWLQDGKTLKSSRPFHEEELYLKNVTSRDAGFYTCRVRTETAIVDVSLEVSVLSVEQEMKGKKPITMKYPTWYYLAGSLGVGILLGIVLVLVMKHVRGKCRHKSNDIYEDVRSSPISSRGLELDITAQYQDMNRNMAVYEEAGSTSPYEIADLTSLVYINMNEGVSAHQEMNPELRSLQNAPTLVAGYTDLVDHRIRVDSHPYQDLQYNVQENIRV